MIVSPPSTACPGAGLEPAPDFTAALSPRAPPLTTSPSSGPLALPLAIRRHGHECVGSPGPELARVGVGRDRDIVQHPVPSLGLEDVDRLERVVEAVELHLSAWRVDLHSAKRGEEYVEALDVALGALERPGDHLRSHVARLGGQAGRALVPALERFTKAPVLRSVERCAPVERYDDAERGVAHLVQERFVRQDALADQRNLALEAEFGVLRDDA